jgi:hypothetical protein
MSQSIAVTYPSDSLTDVNVSYTLDTQDNIHTITCHILGRSYPAWLQLRKFSMSSICSLGIYSPLYNDNNNSKNHDTAFFIDLVYTTIMNRESLKL